MEGVERHTQSYYGYRDWLGPDLTRNKRGRYMPILPVAVALLTPPGQNYYRFIYYWLPLSRSLLYYVYVLPLIMR